MTNSKGKINKKPQLIPFEQELELDGRFIDDVILELQTLREEGFEKFDVTFLEYYGRIEVCGKRLETDVEVGQRLERERRLQEAQDQRDREAYERLKAKFG